MKKLHYIYTVIFMFLFVGCEMDSEDLPTCHNDQLLFDFTTELSTYLDDHFSFMCENIPLTQRCYRDDFIKLELEEKIAYYEPIGNGGYQPSYMSYPDYTDEEISAIEYVFSLHSELDKMDSRLRRDLLSMAVGKHRKKFGQEYTAPVNARKSGIVLILSILQYENASEVLDRICGYCTKYNLIDPFELTHNEEFNQFLIKEVSSYLSK
ncbi:hypothetical protein PSM36_1919 [Proteiniphilum saccharofermentans]|uniref:Uncharacterized protein n=1 Tax=Proteiniphilum saccharofermentans TaxID=1642647 RepID=A0A1R3TAW1_9BACT|nr:MULTISPECIES: hypothetical protein [Proteiniphilum]RNC65414.1 hypothetical protein D7D25_07945 [Proteiniphilum sp. X52]SCD20734.1 hypothetical protein PSM36_1919 [Proteiniphilum saccharofermentans]